MERAATAVADAVCDLADGVGTAVAVCCPGNNGGDGLGCAWQLLRRGWRVRCFLVGDPTRLTADSAQMRRRLELAGGVLEPYDPVQLAAALETADVAVDALFGVGLSRPLQGDALEAVRRLNASPVPVVACDLPSGVAADSGAVLGEAVQAAVTVSFTAAKPGLLLPPGMSCCGRLVIAEIGIPPAALELEPWLGLLPDADWLRTRLPSRPADSHKGDYGRVLLLCGSRGLTGAAALASRAALRTGAGLISLGVSASVYPILAAKLDDEIMVFPLPEDGDGRLSAEAIPALETALERCDACLAGPGLGRGDGVRAVLDWLLQAAPCPLVIDADGINALGAHRNIARACPTVLTPHDGEFVRLGGDPSLDRIEGAAALAREMGSVVLRKGYRTIVTDGVHLRINTTGNPGMACGGSGDALAGILLALLGFGLPALDAAAAAAWIHGAAGDRAAAEIGQYGMTPSDLIQRIPQFLP